MAEYTRRSFVKYAGIALAGGAVFGLAACGGQASEGSASSTQAADAAESSSASVTSESASASSSAATAATASASAAVVFYSRVGENYQVGVIEEGNTAKVAKEIAAQTGADLIEVKPAKAYPDGYDECCDVALAEQEENARPELVEIPDLSAYDTIYLGYPIWWGDLPMFMYTLLETGDFSGKTILPFCTHEGSGLSGTPANIADACPDAEVGEGLDLRGKTAQESPDEVQAAVADWLSAQ
ncbi:MAG: flavodoxin [Coriobacteriia bacterium]|nr:flavodoxin [Coriobacteriia bacterium]